MTGYLTGPIDPEVWQPYDRPGYFGAKRDKKLAAFDRKYGAQNWRLGWLFDGHILDWLAACQIYENAYFEYLVTHEDILNELVEFAGDVYDDDPSNIESGLAYNIQQTDRTHIQDIAVRNCLFRLNMDFLGDNLLQIRGGKNPQPLGRTLSPGRVPFHLPHLIIAPQLKGWWAQGSVESFYQSNKFLLLRRQ